MTPAKKSARDAFVAEARQAPGLVNAAAYAALDVLAQSWTHNIHWNDIDRVVEALTRLKAKGVAASTIGRTTPAGSTIPRGWSMIPDAYVVTPADHAKGDALAEPSPSDLFESQSSAFDNAALRGDHVYGVAAMASMRGPWLVVTPSLR